MPISSFSTFKENLINFVRPNRFEVIITPPSNIALGDEDNRRLTYYTKVAAIPGKSIGEYEVKFAGQSIKLPGDVNFEDLTLTFINDADWTFRTFFEDWQNLILNSKDSSREMAFELLSESSIQINQYGLDDSVLATYVFMHVYPKNISQIDLSMDTENTIEEYQVTFAFSYWKRDFE